jgi:hypothetical protein
MGAKRHRPSTKHGNTKRGAPATPAAVSSRPAEPSKVNISELFWGTISVLATAVAGAKPEWSRWLVGVPLLPIGRAALQFATHDPRFKSRRSLWALAAPGVCLLCFFGLWYALRPTQHTEAIATGSTALQHNSPATPQPETFDQKRVDLKTIIEGYTQTHNGDAPTIAWVDEQLRAQGKTFHLKMAAKPRKTPGIDVEDSTGLTFDHVTTTNALIKLRNSPNNKFDHVNVDMTPAHHSPDEPCPDKNDRIGYMTDGERVYPCKQVLQAKALTQAKPEAQPLGTIALVHAQVSGLHIGGNTILSTPAGAFTATDSVITNSSIEGNKMGPKAGFEHEP